MTETTAVETTVLELTSRRTFDRDRVNDIALWAIHDDSRVDNGLDLLGTIEEIFQGLEYGPFLISMEDEDVWFYFQGSREEMGEIEERFQILVDGKTELDEKKIEEGVESAREYAEMSIPSMIEKHGKILTGLI